MQESMKRFYFEYYPTRGKWKQNKRSANWKDRRSWINTKNLAFVAKFFIGREMVNFLRKFEKQCWIKFGLSVYYENVRFWARKMYKNRDLPIKKKCFVKLFLNVLNIMF